ncbi:MAG: nucleotidyltransferase domain-containing protein [Myxococcales bacterium]|nr:nucleotidyltransferase domain-containing protein [Myxococcales bacterium]
MDTFGLSPRILGTIRQILADFPEVEIAILYGSRAKGTHKPGSDIDLTLIGPQLTAAVLSKIATRLDDSPIPHTVDLSIYADLDHEELRKHIDRFGVVFYDRGIHAESSVARQ